MNTGYIQKSFKRKLKALIRFLFYVMQQFIFQDELYFMKLINFYLNFMQSMG